MTVVLPFVLSLAEEVLGYGKGIGPAGGEGGDRHVSGKAAVDLPDAALQAISIPFA
jgi:hypothetical protein